MLGFSFGDLSCENATLIKFSCDKNAKIKTVDGFNIITQTKWGRSSKSYEDLTWLKTSRDHNLKFVQSEAIGVY